LAASQADRVLISEQHEIDYDLGEGGDMHRDKDVSVPYGTLLLHMTYLLLTQTPPTGQLTVARAALLKHSLRSMHRMMQSSGTAEGLRGLIDSSLIKSVKKVIQDRGLFGGSILSIGPSVSPEQKGRC
jgi:E3 ubiquitin-protein ligase HUWE1